MPQFIVSSPDPILRNPNQRVGIVVSEYHWHINGKLLDGALKTLLLAGIPDECVVVAKVPGAWELCLVCQQLASKSEFVGIIALGAVIRGETSHDQHINRAVSQSLMQISLQANKPIAFGLLTVNTLEQAIQRSGGNVGNKGEESANALVQSLALLNAIS